MGPIAQGYLSHFVKTDVPTKSQSWVQGVFCPSRRYVLISRLSAQQLSRPLINIREVLPPLGWIDEAIAVGVVLLYQVWRSHAGKASGILQASSFCGCLGLRLELLELLAIPLLVQQLLR